MGPLKETCDAFRKDRQVVKLLLNSPLPLVVAVLLVRSCKVLGWDEVGERLEIKLIRHVPLRA